MPKKDSRRVLARCPSTGEVVRTHARMTPAEHVRSRASLALFCPSCGESHLIAADGLWLEPAAPGAESRPGAHAMRRFSA